MLFVTMRPPLEERDKDDSKIIDMKISFEKLGLIVDLMEDALYGDGA